MLENEMQLLTPRQSEVFEAIRELSARGWNPSLRELAARAGMASTGTLRRHLSNLQAKGLVKLRRYRRPRDIALTGRESAIAA
jgi:repressor LexA